MNIRQSYFILVTNQPPADDRATRVAAVVDAVDGTARRARFFPFGLVADLHRQVREDAQNDNGVVYMLFAVDSSRHIYEVDPEAFAADESQNGVWTDIWAKPYTQRIGILRAQDPNQPHTYPFFIASEGVTFQVEDVAA